MKATVAEVMTSEVKSVSPSTPLRAIAAALTSLRVSAMPVVDVEGVVVGVVSEADLMLKELFGSHPSHADAWLSERELSKLDSTIAADLMSSPAITVGPDATLALAAKVMHDRQVKRLPVVDAEGRLLGIVTRGDLLAVFLRADGDIRREIVDEIVVRTLWMDPEGFSVGVDGGVVTLAGKVDRRSDIDVLVGLIRGVDGVVAVHTELGFKYDDTTPLAAGPFRAIL